ncbi:MAG: fumarylacetoacetate hydrolase family protein [Aquabacterium sp.]
MKLATLKDGSRDGQLVVVSRDGTTAHFASAIAGRLQQVLDDWNFLSPQLEDLYQTLNQGKARHAFAFDARACMAPLPRAFQWAEAVPGDPVARLRQGAGDDLLGPCDDARFAGEAGAIACGAGLAVVTGDLPMSATAAAALEGVRLLLLAASWRQGPAGPGGVDPHTPWPAAAFGPLAVTPDELGDAWRGGRVHGRLDGRLNGQGVAAADAAAGMPAHFGQLIAGLARVRRVRAGSIVGSGPLATIGGGEPGAPGLRRGDHGGIELAGSDGHSVFGATAQVVAPAAG